MSNCLVTRSLAVVSLCICIPGAPAYAQPQVFTDESDFAAAAAALELQLGVELSEHTIEFDGHLGRVIPFEGNLPGSETISWKFFEWQQGELFQASGLVVRSFETTTTPPSPIALGLNGPNPEFLPEDIIEVSLSVHPYALGIRVITSPLGPLPNPNVILLSVDEIGAGVTNDSIPEQTFVDASTMQPLGESYFLGIVSKVPFQRFTITSAEVSVFDYTIDSMSAYSPPDVPTVSQMGLVVLGCAVLVAGMIIINKRRRALETGT